MLRRSCQLWLQGLKPSEESADQKLVMFISFFKKSCWMNDGGVKKSEQPVV